MTTNCTVKLVDKNTVMRLKLDSVFELIAFMNAIYYGRGGSLWLGGTEINLLVDSPLERDGAYEYIPSNHRQGTQ